MNRRNVGKQVHGKIARSTAILCRKAVVQTTRNQSELLPVGEY